MWENVGNQLISYSKNLRIEKKERWITILARRIGGRISEFATKFASKRTDLR
jgi:hypothetical protein